mgnify:CR=1 FL=1
MNKLFRFVVAAIIVFAAPHTFAADDTKSILVTGASTGIGRHLTETLAEAGYHVYAGARKDEDLAELGAIENITAVRLDVTRQDQVDAAVERLRAALRRATLARAAVPVFAGSALLDLGVDALLDGLP